MRHLSYHDTNFSIPFSKNFATNKVRYVLIVFWSSPLVVKCCPLNHDKNLWCQVCTIQWTVENFLFELFKTFFIMLAQCGRVLFWVSKQCQRKAYLFVYVMFDNKLSLLSLYLASIGRTIICYHQRPSDKKYLTSFVTKLWRRD